MWEVWVHYVEINEHVCIDYFDDELAAHRFKNEVKEEFWVEESKIYVRQRK